MTAGSSASSSIPGREIMESQDGSLPVAYAPSAVPNERFHVHAGPAARPA